MPEQTEKLRADVATCLKGLREAQYETGAIARAAVQQAVYQLERALKRFAAPGSDEDTK